MKFVLSTLLLVAGTLLANAAEVRRKGERSFQFCINITCSQYESCLQTPKLEPFILKNHRSVEAHILPYGAIVQKLMVPDRSGKPTDVVLGFDSLTPYEVSVSVILLSFAHFMQRELYFT